MAQRAEVAAIVSHLMDRGQHSLVIHASSEPLAVQPFQQRHHDPARTLQSPTQFAHSSRSALGNEFGDSRLYMLEVFAQHNCVCAHCDRFATLDHDATDKLPDTTGLD